MRVYINAFIGARLIIKGASWVFSRARIWHTVVLTLSYALFQSHENANQIRSVQGQ